MLNYEAPDDSEIYTYHDKSIDVPLPLKEAADPSSVKRGIYCYEATAARDDDWTPCRGDYLVMRHPLMINNFTVALSKEKVIRAFYNGNFLLPEERFVEISYFGAPYGYDYDRFRNFIPRLQNHSIGFRGVYAIYGLYAPYHQGWVDDAAPRKCFFLYQDILDSSYFEWDFLNAIMRFDFLPETTDLLRRHEDKLFFPYECGGIKEKIGFNQTYSSYYIIAESPEYVGNHDWMW